MLSKLFIKNHEDIENPKVRRAYGTMCGIVGVIANLIVCIGKVLVGFFTGAISIVADGINNLADAGSSVLTLVGFKLSSKAPNKNHPFGYERIEYVTGLIVSLLIILIGVLLMRTSIEKLISKETLIIETNIAIVTIVVLVISIFIKLFLSLFNRKYGKLINSTTLIATGTDSLNDCISTGAVLIALVVSLFYPNHFVDGIMGILVSLFIFYSGVKLVKETISPLIGEAPSKEFINFVTDKITGYPGVLGYHDLVIHSYGPKKIFITVHVEVDSKVPINESHDMVDNIEKDFLHESNINLVIHMDPIDVDDHDVSYLKEQIHSILNNINPDLKFHDFRLVKGETHTNVLFDVVIPSGYKIEHQDLKLLIDKEVNKIEYKTILYTVIVFDIDYTGGNNE